MKKTVFLLVTAMMWFTGIKAQIPWTYNSSGNTVLSSGYTYLSATDVYIGASTYQVSSTAQLDVAASNEIHVQPEFRANPSGSGFTHLYIDPNMFDVASFHANGFTNIPKYDRFELGIKIPASIQSQINTFLTTYSGPSQGINPYDPDQITVKCVFNSSLGNSFTRNGFYYQPYSVTNNTWIEGTTDYPFRIRFAPPDIGSYSCNINIYIPGQPAIAYNNIQFTVANSNNPGHLKMAAPNLKKMKFEDNTPFFGIGQNFANPESVITPTVPYGIPLPPILNPSFNYTQLDVHACKSSPHTNVVQRSYIRDLASKKGNFIRLRLDPNGYPLEYMDYRSLVSATNNVPNRYTLERCLNNYQHNQMFLGELDSVLQICENPQSRVYLMLNILNDGLSHRDGLGDFARWKDFPYADLLGDLGGSNNSIRSFFNDALPKSYFKKQLYYINARWGYSTSIAMWEFINETENIEGYQHADVSTNYVDPLLPNTIKDWVCEMSNYMHNFYPSHLTTNGTTETPNGGGPFNNYILSSLPPCLDVFSANKYTNEIGDANNPAFYMDHFNQKDMLHGGGADWFNTQNVPFIYGEIGLGVQCAIWYSADPYDHSHTSYYGTPWTDAEVYNDRSFHNNLWATTVAGNLATGLNWMDYSQLHVDHRKNYRALSEFVSQVDWTKELSPKRYSTPILPYVTYGNETYGDDPNHHSPIHHLLDNLYMKDVSSDYVVGWSMINTSFWAYDQNYSGFPNYQNLLTCVNFDPSKVIDYDISPDPNDAPIEIQGMNLPNHWYRAEIFDTYNVNINSFSLPVFSDGSNIIRFHMPFYNHDGGTVHDQTADRAYIIRDDLDTWSAGADPYRENNEQPETNRGVQYPSDLNRNGDQGGRMASPGTREIIKYDNGRTVKETITNLKQFDLETQKINAFPNPANSFITINYNESYFTNAEISVYDLAGKMVRQINDSKTLDVRDLDQGLYLVTFKNDQFVKTFKISLVH